MNRTFCTWFLRLGKDVSCVRVSHVPVPKNACEHLLVTKRMCMNQETRDRKCPCCLCKKHTQPPSLPGTPTVPEGALSAIPRQGGFSSRIWHQSLFVSCEKSLHRAHTHTHSQLTAAAVYDIHLFFLLDLCLQKKKKDSKILTTNTTYIPQKTLSMNGLFL